MTDDEQKTVQNLIYKHLEATESARAKEILADWQKFAGKFWKVQPKSAKSTAEAKPAMGQPAGIPAVAKTP